MVQQGGMGNTEAERELQGTVSSDKNEILFSRFGINYNNEEEMFKKGSVVYRQYQLEEIKSKGDTASTSEPEGESMSKTQQEKSRKLRRKAKIIVEHIDIIKDEFWEKRPWILSNKPGKLPVES
ncbi:tRNAHis guanylyltransferase [Aspergillus sclerotialis]|uniref:tRNAHis guanylyltransferase n=1 Tax=Aspergillus sclerotialis TaxID=2070753 RepID=A0A3A2Z6J3_9EURO|nr:tRNAHis guanylyltransferase [Aspergillus sclerotialis]